MLILHFNSETPKVAYPRAIDVFMGMCMTFIFCTLLETVFVHLSEGKTIDNITEVNDVTNKDDVEEVSLSNVIFYKHFSKKKHN